VLRLSLCLEEYRPALERNDSQLSRQISARFHRAVVEETGNTAMIMIINMLYELIERHQSVQMSSHKFSKSVIERGLQSETHLLGLIERGEAEEAERHWRVHVEHSNRRWLAVGDPDAKLSLLSPRAA
jgi:DNA-binding FadR family transcriptional regulator